MQLDQLTMPLASIDDVCSPYLGKLGCERPREEGYGREEALIDGVDGGGDKEGGTGEEEGVNCTDACMAKDTENY